MITERLVLEGGYPDGLWACAGCGVKFSSGAEGSGTFLVHRDDCPEMALVAAAERERVFDLLGHDHYVIFTRDRWTIEHSVECRLSGHMHECAYHAAVSRVTRRRPAASQFGRWRIDSIDSEGMPSLVRADLNGSTPGE